MRYIGFEWWRKDLRKTARHHRDWLWWLATWLPYNAYMWYLDVAIAIATARLRRRYRPKLDNSTADPAQ